MDIKSIYIVDGIGNPLYARELYAQGALENQQMLFTNLVAAIQQFAVTLGEEEAKVIELGNDKIFSTGDTLTNLKFILKCDKKMKQKKAFALLDNIKNAFLNKFTGKFTSSADIKSELMKDFILEMDQLINPKSSVESLLGSL